MLREAILQNRMRYRKGFRGLPKGWVLSWPPPALPYYGPRTLYGSYESFGWPGAC